MNQVDRLADECHGYDLDGNPILDATTVAHLCHWIDRQFGRNHAEDRSECALFSRMSRVIADDPDYWLNQDYWRIHDVAWSRYPA